MRWEGRGRGRQDDQQRRFVRSKTSGNRKLINERQAKHILDQGLLKDLYCCSNSNVSFKLFLLYLHGVVGVILYCKGFPGS